ncbi:MAG: LamG-like jellyroll fold domain-containing protein, partial [Verrucomicrobiota bacterium]
DTGVGQPGGSAFVVAKTTDFSNNDTLMSSATNHQFFRQAGNNVRFDNGLDPLNDPLINTDTVIVDRIRYADFNQDRPDRVRYFINGRPQSVNNQLNLSVNGWELTTVGGFPPGACCSQWKGDIAEILIWDRVLSDEEQALVGTYLKNKYTIAADYARNDALSVANLPASGVTEIAATLNGLLAASNAVADVTLYFGASDGGNDPMAWDNSFPLGWFTDTVQNVSRTFQGLMPDTTYYYTWRLTNCVWESWSGPSRSFTTPTYSNAVKMTFCGYPGGETLTNFPALVRLGTHISGFDYKGFSSPSGGDLRFFNHDLSRELNYEIEIWDTNASSLVWVQIPELVDANTCIFAKWGTLVTQRPAYTTNGSVWSEGYTAVWHFADSAIDSAHTSDGTTMGGVSYTGGQVGRGVDLDGVDGYIDVGDGFADFSKGITVEAWVNYDTFQAWSRVIDFGVGEANGNIVMANVSTGGRLQWQLEDTLGGPEVQTVNPAPSFFSPGQWQYVVATIDAG